MSVRFGWNHRSIWGWHRESLRRGVCTVYFWRLRVHYWLRERP